MLDRRRFATSIPLPAQSRIASFYAKTDLADAYAIELPDHASGRPEELARFVFSHLPPWMRRLMRLRDALVGGFGLKTAAKLQSMSDEELERRVGIFHVYDSGPDEIVFGEDDRHLNFRLSLLCRPASPTSSARQVVLSTVVRCHNVWGRLYLAVIAPFHRRIARSSLNNAARIGWPQAARRQASGPTG